MLNELTGYGLLILVELFLLLMILLFIIAIRRQLKNIEMNMPRAEPSVTSTPTPEQLVVLGADVETKETVEQVEKEPEEEKPAEPETFKCKKCGKEFKDKKKLQRHIGMAHYQDLEI